MDIKNLTAEERQALKAELEQQELAEKRQHEEDINTYKGLTDETVKKCFPELIGVSEKLIQKKAKIREEFRKLIELKQNLYGMKESQKSHTFIDADGQFKISLGVYVLDAYDDTVDVGIQKVKDYISSLATDPQAKILVDTIMKLLAKDQKGTLKASRVLQLQQMAERCGDADFLEGVKIIGDAYQPIESKSFIRAEFKDENGEWKNVPLGMTEA